MKGQEGRVPGYLTHHGVALPQKQNVRPSGLHMWGWGAGAHSHAQPVTDEEDSSCWGWWRWWCLQAGDSGNEVPGLRIVFVLLSCV